MNESQQSFKQLCNDVFTRQLKRYPEDATWLGFHEFDGDTMEFSQSALDQDKKTYVEFQQRLNAINQNDLDLEEKTDYGVLECRFNDVILELENIRPWRFSPEGVNDLVNWGLFTLAKRNFAPLDERAKSAIGRLKNMPETLEQAKKLLTEPFSLPMSISLPGLESSVAFFGNTLPIAFAGIKDHQLLSQFYQANQIALDAFRGFVNSMKEVKQISGNGWQLGEKVYAQKLKYAELIDYPLADVWNVAKAELEKLQTEFDETAKQIDNTKTPEQVFESISIEHPTADDLIPYTTNMLEEIRQFCLDNHLVSIPSEVRCQIAPTPEFMRDLTFASMDSPGPYEKTGTDAYYNVTLADPSWTADATEQHMRMYNKYTLAATSIHEAYPGHYVQFLQAKNISTDIRKLFYSYSSIEGWAHYTEHLAYEFNFWNGDPKFRLAQLHEALLRACRAVAAIGLHTGEYSIEKTVEVFVKQGHMEKANAEREAKRGVLDPMYSNYTLGKLMLLKLRDDVKNTKGDSFDLRSFHDEFLSIGSPPIPLVRERMLGERGEALTIPAKTAEGKAEPKPEVKKKK